MVPVVAVAPYQLKESPYSSHSLLLESLPPEGRGRRVLDVGCAGGYLGAKLAARGYRVTGIDSPGAAGPNFPDSVKLVEADLECGLPPLNGRFDFVICADVLEHLRRPDLMLGEVREVLARDGRLAASLPNSGHAWFRWTVLRGRFPAQDRGLFDRTHLHFFTWRGWAELLRAQGFSIETLRCSAVPVGLAVPRWKDAGWVRALERWSFESARVWKSMFAYQFIVTATPEVEP
ncbi:MAG TPA: class I SAM-dependent methyltransferase [Bryobacteraceae bacterium]|nr:class I SAM-dependent methyltransferase [Bryobacteraceae bacterium]